MKTIVDNETGALIMIPQSDKDHRLIFHLINCCELSEFSRYLELENDTDKDITESLDVNTDQLLSYPSRTQWQRVDREPVELVKQNSSLDGGTRLIGNLIGFKV